MIDPWEENESGVTVGELMERLKNYPKKTPVCFGPHGYFSYRRVKDRGGVVQIEFNEITGDDYEISDSHPYSQYLKQAGLA